MTVGQLKKALKDVPDHFEIVDYYNGLELEEVDVDGSDQTVYLTMEDD